MAHHRTTPSPSAHRQPHHPSLASADNMTVDPSLASNKAVRDLSSLISGSNFNGLVNALERLVMADWAVSQEASGGGYGDDGEAEDSLVSFRELEAVLPKEVACVKMLRLKYCITLPNKVRHHRTAPRPVPPHLATPPPQLLIAGGSGGPE